MYIHDQLWVLARSCTVSFVGLWMRCIALPWHLHTVRGVSRLHCHRWTKGGMFTASRPPCHNHAPHHLLAEILVMFHHNLQLLARHGQCLLQFLPRHSPDVPVHIHTGQQAGEGRCHRRPHSRCAAAPAAPFMTPAHNAKSINAKEAHVEATMATNCSRARSHGPSGTMLLPVQSWVKGPRTYTSASQHHHHRCSTSWRIWRFHHPLQCTEKPRSRRENMLLIK